MRIAILGTGALGGFYGGLLAYSGIETHFLCHRDAQQIRRNGLRVESVLGDFLLEPVNAYSSVQEMPKCDVVFICLKTTNNHLLAELLPPLLDEGSRVVVLQNGWGMEQEVADLIGPDFKIYGGCCFLCSNKIGPGHIRHLDYGRITLGRFVPDRGSAVTSTSETLDASRTDEDVELDDLIAMMRRARIEVVRTDCLAEARWRKLMWNIPFNGLSVVMDSTTLDLMNDEHGKWMCESLMREVRTVANKLGLGIEAEFVDKLMADTLRMVPYDSSMRLDYLAQRPMEVRAIFENPLWEAERLGARCDLLGMLYHQLRFLDQRNRLGQKS